MLFVDRALAKRLERAEGYACAEFAEARRRLFPDSGSETMEYAGANVVFDGVDAPTTQTFGLGLFEELTAASLDVVERFFFERGSHVDHEISPFAGVAALDLLCERGYKPIEICSVLYRPVAQPAAELPANTRVRVCGAQDEQLWTDISTRGWSHEHPELIDFLVEAGAIFFARAGSPCFLAELDGQPGAAGALILHEGVALFGGAATVPGLRRQGLQAALLDARLRHAFNQGCDLAMMVAEVGSNSQRNAQRQGFQIAYTRTKWRLNPQSH